jgi:ferric-dicitrate binding protein FerR (iron transport regulator)
MTLPERDVLIVRYLDGSAGPEEVAALNSLLESDAEARSLLRETSYQALVLADLGRSRALKAASRPIARSRWNPRLLAAAAALLVAAGLGTVAILQATSPTLTLVRATGGITWSPAGGLPQTGPEAGTPLGAGTILLEGAESCAELGFRDGSILTLSGPSEVTIPGGSGKRLYLRRGSITIEARPQPANRPLVLRTPTADVEVVGTCFSLTAEGVQTTVAVDAGKVRLRRLVDGAAALVPEGQVAVATLDATAPLESRPAPVPAARWGGTFEHPPGPAWQGEWMPADATGPGRLRNVMDVSYRRKDGTVVPAQVVSVRDPVALTTIRPESILRLRWRLRNPPGGPMVLLSVGHPDGRFAGNFQTILDPETSPPDANGWRATSVPVSSLEGRYPEGARLPAIGRLKLVFMACYTASPGLEVAEVALD